MYGILQINVGATVMLFAGGTGLGPSASISKNGAGFGASSNSPVEVSNGWYSLALTTGEVDTPGPLAIHLSAGTPQDFLFQVSPVAVADVQGWNGSAVANLDGSNVRVSVQAMADGVLTRAKMATDVMKRFWEDATIVESYAADGAAPTPAQLAFMLWSALSEFAISGATLTCKKLDGTTAAMTFTLAPSGNPTSRTRAT